MTLPSYLQEKISMLLKLRSITHLQEARQAVTSRYRTHNITAFQSQEERLSYLATRLPATYAVACLVLEHLKPYTKTLASHLDLGSGPGTVFIAAHTVLPEIQQTTLFEKDPFLIELGKQLMPDDTSPLWHQGDLYQLSSLEATDLITMSYVMNELKDSEGIITKAWSITRHFLVLIEPGTPRGFAQIRAAREQLIQQGAFILAPCTHENLCPMHSQDWCHFKAKVQRASFHQKVKQSPKGFEEEKFSYVIASKSSLKRDKARIVKNPLRRSGHITLDLCNENGLRRQVISKKKDSFYRAARNIDWGDPWNH